jgi:hypothetical protein
MYMPDILVTILTVAVLGVIIFLAARSVIKSKKEGKGSCGCKCSSCPYNSNCNKA